MDSWRTPVGPPTDPNRQYCRWHQVSIWRAVQISSPNWLLADSWQTPETFMTDSWQTPDGLPTDSWRTPDGLPMDSRRTPDKPPMDPQFIVDDIRFQFGELFKSALPWRTPAEPPTYLCRTPDEPQRNPITLNSLSQKPLHVVSPNGLS
jgi:hypothetical protein